MIIRGLEWKHTFVLVYVDFGDYIYISPIMMNMLAAVK